MKKIDCVTVGSLETNCWLYALESGSDNSGTRPCVVIDPGDEADMIISRLQELNWVPRFIFLTHGHFDHLMALPELLEAFGKGAFASALPPKIGIHRQDAHYLGKDAMKQHRSSFAAVGGDPRYIEALWKPLGEADILFEEGDDVGPFKVFHLPGHSPGSAGFYDETTGVLFSGDTLFRGNRGRTDLPGGNEKEIRESLARLLSMKGEIVVCPGHGPATTIEEEKESFIF
jgi:glyoxylase-like metal-dependent hydrolase (beta-lactamase superfamily II)